MEQETIDTEVLVKMLADPANARFANSLNVRSLVDEFPQSGIFRALLAADGNGQNVRQGAVYFDPATLYKLINAPDSLRVVTSEQVFLIDQVLRTDIIDKKVVSVKTRELYDELSSNREENKDDDQAIVQDLTTKEPEPDFYKAMGITPTESSGPDFYKAMNIPQPAGAEKPQEDDVPDFFKAMNIEQSSKPADEETPLVEDIEVEEEAATATPEPDFYKAMGITPYSAQESAPVENNVADQDIDAAEDKTEQPQAVYDDTPSAIPQEEELVPQPAIEVPAPTEDTYTPPAAPEPAVQEIHLAQPEPVTYDDPPIYFHEYVDDEVYDEIVSIEDISLQQLEALKSEPFAMVDDEEDAAETPAIHFTFDHQPEPEEEVKHPYIPAIIVPVNEQTVEGKKRDVSKYFDENLPYTFMWWLDKTRREHDPNYQPYANEDGHKQYTGDRRRHTTNDEEGKPLDDLQKQYIESIVNTNVINEVGFGETKMGRLSDGRKEDDLIDRFIRSEPQIKPSGALKLDNENKAKKSSEEKDELITETLARIYTEQMLYGKAIAAYKKLMLKFPEKSLYFAAQIEQLEKKPN